MIKVSVIVPVYNVEEYLERCLDSLAGQTLEEFEIIVVNDGSTDGSQEIINDYTKKSNKIRAFQKENGGLSDARNFGMAFASGEYIGYVDSDDFVETDMYEILYKRAKEDGSDIAECNLRHKYPDSEDIEIGETIYDKKKILMFGRSVAWNKIYKRDWLIATKVGFPKGLIYEDVQFFSMLVPHIRKYSYVEPASIHYVQRSGSLNNMSAKASDILKILMNVRSYYLENGFYKEFESALEFLFARILLCSSFARTCHMSDKSDREDILKRNWGLLEETFPDWKKNGVFKQKKSRQILYMRTINSVTYRIYGKILPMLYSIVGRVGRKS